MIQFSALVLQRWAVRVYLLIQFSALEACPLERLTPRSDDGRSPGQHEQRGPGGMPFQLTRALKAAAVRPDGGTETGTETRHPARW